MKSIENMKCKLIFMQKQTQTKNKEVLREEHQELAEGLLYTHTRINSNTKKPWNQPHSSMHSSTA